MCAAWKHVIWEAMVLAALKEAHKVGVWPEDHIVNPFSLLHGKHLAHLLLRKGPSHVIVVGRPASQKKSSKQQEASQ